MKTLSKTLAAIGAVGALSVAAVPLALAQAATAEPDATEESVPREGRHGARETEYVSRLAAELGLDEAAVAAAVTAVREELAAEHQAERLADLQARLDAAVAAGELSQEQAGAIAAAAESGFGGFGVGGGPGRGFGRGFGFHVPPGGADDAAASEGETA